MGIFPTVLGIFPTLLGIFPRLLGIFPTLLGIFPRLLGIFPRLLGIFPTPLGENSCFWFGSSICLIGLDLWPNFLIAHWRSGIENNLEER